MRLTTSPDTKSKIAVSVDMILLWLAVLYVDYALTRSATGSAISSVLGIVAFVMYVILYWYTHRV